MLAFYRCLLWIIDFVFYKIWINLIRNSFRFVRDVDLRTCTIHRHYDRPFTIYSIFLTYFSQSNENIGFYCCSDLVANDGNKAVSFIQLNYLLSESNKINNWNMRYFQQIFIDHTVWTWWNYWFHLWINYYHIKGMTFFLASNLIKTFKSFI